jgi:hypothetical protein
MIKSSVDLIQEAANKELAHLKTTRNLRVFLGIIPEPGYLRIPYDCLLAIDRWFFGNDLSRRRKIFGLTPWPIKPFYRCYDRLWNKWVAKQPLHWS